MNAPFDRLHADLADLAEQVTVVDLRDRTLRTSHNIGVRRNLLGAAAAVAVLAIGAGTAFAVLPDRHTALPAGPGPSTSPSAVASPSVAVPTGSPSGQVPTADPVPGMYMFRFGTPDGRATNDVLYRPPGGDWRAIATAKVPSTPTPPGPPPIVVSPDHKHIAWYSLDRKLQISDLEGTHITTVVNGLADHGCLAPFWAADSRHLLFEPSSTSKGMTIEAVAIDGTGRHTLGTLPPASCKLVSPDGSAAYAVTFGAGGGLVVLNGGTQPQPITAAWPAGQQPWEVVAVSAGSTRLLVATASRSQTCGCSPPERYTVVDTATGRVTSLDNSNDRQGSMPVSGFFTTDGRVVLLADHNRSEGARDMFLTVFGPDGSIVGSAALPTMSGGYLLGLDG